MKEVIVRASCDRHYPDSCPGGDVRDVVVWGRTIDLCDDHRAELVEPLRELVDAVGVRPEPEPEPAHTGKRLHNPCLCGRANANDAHVKGAHGLSIGELFGSRCPVCGETFKLPSGMGTHASRAHGTNGSGAAFEMARLAGDPYGVVADRRAVLDSTRGS